MSITRAQQAKQMLQSGGEVLGPLGEEDNLQSGFVSGARGLITPGNIGRGLAFILSGGASSASEIAKEIARQKTIDELQKKAGDMIRPKVQTELMQRQNEMMGTGGYQSDFAQDSGFMGGRGTSAEMGSFAVGGLADGNFDFESARQMYGLGKLVKKVTKTVKKIAKSPIGKAAITAASLYYMPKFGIKAQGGLPAFLQSAKIGAQNLFLGTPIAGDVTGTRSGGIFNFIKDNPMVSIFGASAIAGALTPAEQIQAQKLAEEEGIDLEAAKNSILAARREQYMMDLRSRGFKAEGGRIGLRNGGDDDADDQESSYDDGPLLIPDDADLSPDDFYGRKEREGIMKMASAPDPMDSLNDMAQMLFGKNLDQLTDDEYIELLDAARDGASEGGSIKEPVAKKTMPLLDMGGKEMDLREEGGFVPIGRMEKADDVPARLSKNEFVFTADAVRNAGDGNVDKGAEVMYNMMKNLEAGGEVSEESQGLKGARKMFQTSQRLEEVL